MRLIDADELLLSMMLITPGETKKYCYPCREILKEIDDAPTIEPERKKGRWIDETFKPWGLVHHPYKCDQCGEHSEADSNFCPNCGAKMEEPEEGNV